eukprot:jgi/Psemu1/493/gm1.493_g
MAGAQKLGEIQVHWIPRKTNPADLFTKEHKDVAHCNHLHSNLIVQPWVVILGNQRGAYSTAGAIGAAKLKTKYNQARSISNNRPRAVWFSFGNGIECLDGSTFPTWIG